MVINARAMANAQLPGQTRLKKTGDGIKFLHRTDEIRSPVSTSRESPCSPCSPLL
ncbi:hypothetical protein HMPREF9446_02507 [Bacteroides fluxus YIT 12057]|uniref:Uncharacterized protein n=2 Tax=Bacteroides fluxus TaxID=626930 RepID=F3PUN4_9BACE|nr:hypothetical protein HMPREF9446_02507 [Bacteroides fluxus YIT 12057]